MHFSCSKSLGIFNWKHVYTSKTREGRVGILHYVNSKRRDIFIGTNEIDRKFTKTAQPTIDIRQCIPTYR